MRLSKAAGRKADSLRLPARCFAGEPVQLGVPADLWVSGYSHTNTIVMSLSLFRAHSGVFDYGLVVLRLPGTRHMGIKQA